MDTAILSGEVGRISWRLEFRYDGSVDCRMECKRNGAEAPELLDVLLSVFVDVLKKRVPAETPLLENSCVGEGLVGEFSLSCKDDGELPESELAECQAAIGATFAEFLETHPDEANEITGNAILAARAADAARMALAFAQRRSARTLDFPELPKRIRWATPAPDIQQMRMDLLATLQSGGSPREIVANCQNLQNELQRSKDARVMAYFKADFERAQELLDEKLELHGLARRIDLPEDLILRLGFLPSRSAAWRLELQLHDVSQNSAKAAVLSAKFGTIPGLKRRGDGFWRISLGPIGNLAAFRKAAWPVYVSVYNRLRAICLEIFPS